MIFWKQIEFVYRWPKSRFEAWKDWKSFLKLSGVNTIFFRSTAIVLGCLNARTLRDGRKVIDVHGLRVFNDRSYAFRTAWRRATDSKKYAHLTKMTGELAEELGEDTLKLFQREAYVARLRGTSKGRRFDIHDSGGRIIASGDKDALKRYFDFIKRSSPDRRSQMAIVNRRLRREKTSWFNRSRARKRGYNLKASKNGGSPDYSIPPGDQYLYGGSAGRKSVTRVQITGNRDADFKQAWEAIGITDRKKQAEISELYVWHHVDDLDPDTLTGTMQLVLREAHEGIPHTGSCSQLKELLGLAEYR